MKKSEPLSAIAWSEPSKPSKKPACCWPAHTNTYVNRLYYASFYAVSALLLLHDKSFAKHSGIRSAFHREFVRSGIVSKELGHLYDRLFDSRQSRLCRSGHVLP